jgi:hypothetical protein
MTNTAPKIVAFDTVFMLGWNIWAITTSCLGYLATVARYGDEARSIYPEYLPLRAVNPCVLCVGRHSTIFLKVRYGDAEKKNVNLAIRHPKTQPSAITAEKPGVDTRLVYYAAKA